MLLEEQAESRGTLELERRLESRPEHSGTRTNDPGPPLGMRNHSSFTVHPWYPVTSLCCCAKWDGGPRFRWTEWNYLAGRDHQWRWWNLSGAPEKVPTRQQSYALLHPRGTGGHQMQSPGLTSEQEEGGCGLCKAKLNHRAHGMSW